MSMEKFGKQINVRFCSRKVRVSRKAGKEAGPRLDNPMQAGVRKMARDPPPNSQDPCKGAKIGLQSLRARIRELSNPLLHTLLCNNPLEVRLSPTFGSAVDKRLPAAGLHIAL